MIVRAITSDGDWMFGKGKNDYRQNLQAVSQNIKTRLLSFLGDCFFDITAGIDWFNLLGSKQQMALMLSINTTILNTNGVTGLVQSPTLLVASTRAFTITFRVQTVYGTVEDTFKYSLVG